MHDDDDDDDLRNGKELADKVKKREREAKRGRAEQAPFLAYFDLDDESSQRQDKSF